MIEPDGTGVTIQESSEHGQRQFERIKRNTLDHKLPQIDVWNSRGEMLELTKLINKPTFILAMDSDCGIGQMYARENFPMALNRPSVDRSQFDVIFLVSTYRDQTFESDEVVAFRKDMEGIYENVYLISEENAQKMNATGVSTLLVDGDAVVMHYRKGTTFNPEVQVQIFDHMLSDVGLRATEK